MNLFQRTWPLIGAALLVAGHLVASTHLAIAVLSLPAFIHLVLSRRANPGWRLGCYASVVFAHALALLWMPSALWGAMQPAAALGVWAFLALYSAVFPVAALVLAGRLRERGVPWVWTVPPLWCIAEVIRAELFAGFDWLAVAYTAADSEIVLHLVGWLGVHGVSGLLVAVGALSRDLAERLPASIPAQVGIAVAMLVAASVRCPCDDADAADAPRLQIAAIQASGAELEWIAPVRAAIAAGAEVVLGPEGLLGDRPTLVARGADLLFGVQTACGREHGRRCVQNSVIHFGPAGDVLARLAKQVLVPIYEADLGWLRAANAVYMRRGEGHAIADVRGIPTGIAICYEIASARYVAAMVVDGAQWIFHPTSDTWQRGRIAVRQHLRIARVRAAELGVPIVRVSNAEPTTRIDGHGRATPLAGPHANAAVGQAELVIAGRSTLARRLAGWMDAVVLIFSACVLSVGIVGHYQLFRGRGP